ncbi:trypsin-like peptidase domain-containing protein, partial [candidate division KSB1 bacterium]
MFCKKCGKESDDSQKFCTKCGENFKLDSLINKRIFGKNRLLIGGFFIFIIVAITTYILLPSKLYSDNIAEIVVNIYCESEFNEEASGGSGTIFSEDGLVLTNAHIIPINTETGLIDDESVCIVVLPDPSTGAPDEIYYAYPIIVPEISELYDLAFMQIHDVFYDHEEGIAYGDYPKKFPSYIGDQCKEEDVKLGEPLKVYGYPAISGGYALTITDGVVSSLLLEEGLIITSAKISLGNSGGLAVDKNGCMIGIPS